MDFNICYNSFLLKIQICALQSWKQQWRMWYHSSLVVMYMWVWLHCLFYNFLQWYDTNDHQVFVLGLNKHISCSVTGLPLTEKSESLVITVTERLVDISLLLYFQGWGWFVSFRTSQENKQFYDACTLPLVPENDQGLVLVDKVFNLQVVWMMFVIHFF